MKCCIIAPVIRCIQLYCFAICFPILIKRYSNSFSPYPICIISIFPYFLNINIHSTWIIMNIRKRNHIIHTIPHRIFTFIILWNIFREIPLLLIIFLDIRKCSPIILLRQSKRLNFFRRLMCRFDRDRRWPDLGCIVIIIPYLL